MLVKFSLNDIQESTNQFYLKNRIVVKTSKLGLEMKDQENLSSHFNITIVEHLTVNQTWEFVLRAQKQTQNLKMKWK